MFDEDVNRVALRQLGVFQEDDEPDAYFRNRSPHTQHLTSNSAIASEIARKIAKAAFNSDEWAPNMSSRLKEARTNLLDHVKRAIERPGVKEGLILTSIFAFKIGLWYAYRHAARNGLNVVEL